MTNKMVLQQPAAMVLKNSKHALKKTHKVYNKFISANT
jgi:hypothetical protein